MLTACPDCGGNLGRSATKCRCGWKAPVVLQAHAAAEKKMTPCAADPSCRYPGLMWVSGLNPNQRICVVHYGRHPERHYDDMPQKMINVQAKPVAGG